MNGMNLFENLNNRLKNERQWAMIEWGRTFNAIKMIIFKKLKIFSQLQFYSLMLAQ